MNLTLTCTPPGHPSLPFEIRACGSVDAATKNTLLEAAVDALTSGHDVVVDAAGVDFIDCDGAGTFVEIASAAQTAQRAFTLGARSARLQFVLDLIDLGDAWTQLSSDTVSNTA